MTTLEVRTTWLGPRRSWRVLVGPRNGPPRAVADVRGRRMARQLCDLWRDQLAAGTDAAGLRVPPTLPGRLRPDLLDTEGFGEVGPDELAG